MRLERGDDILDFRQDDDLYADERYGDYNPADYDVPPRWTPPARQRAIPVSVAPTLTPEQADALAAEVAARRAEWEREDKEREEYRRKVLSGQLPWPW